MRNPTRRMELEGRLQCPSCGHSPYLLYRRQAMEPDGTLRVAHESVLWPTHPNVAPPLHPEHITCPECHDELRRVAS